MKSRQFFKLSLRSYPFFQVPQWFPASIDEDNVGLCGMLILRRYYFRQITFDSFTCSRFIIVVESRKKLRITGVYSFSSPGLHLFNPVIHETRSPTRIAVKKPTHVYQRYDIL